MYKIGVRAHDVGRFSPDELARKIKEIGFDGIQLVFKKALTEMPDFNHLDDIKKAFDHDLEIYMLGAYFNPVHPDLNEVKNGIEYFKKCLKVAKLLNAGFVGSETGSLMGSPWGYLPENHSDESLDKATKVFTELVLYAQEHDAYVAIEGAYGHVAYSPKRLKQMIDRINNPHAKVTIDLYNFLNFENYEQRMDILDESLALLKDDIVIFHLKDFIIDGTKLKQVALGEGLMNYPEILRRIVREAPDAYLIFEGVPADSIVSSYAYIRSILKKMEEDQK